MPRLVEDSVTPDTGLSCLIFMLRLMGHPADPEQIRHDHAVRGRAMETLDILRAAKRFGLKARSVTTSWDRLAATPLPAIAKRRDGRYFIIAKIDGDRVLIQDPLESKPLALPRAVVEPAWAGELVLMARRAGLDLAQVRFGIGWFVPALLKYRRLFSEILLASFMLQVFGLISPLFFQVVVDKVLAHRSLTTLDILVVGLVVVSLFETVLGGPHSFNLIWSKQSFRDENPKTYRAFLDALREAMDLINANHDAAADAYLAQNKGSLDKAYILRLLNDPDIRFTVTPNRTEAFADFMHKVGAIKNKPASWKDYFFDDLHDGTGS